MKKFLIVILILAFHFNENAQLKKGRMMLGVNFNYYQNKDNRNDTTTYVGQTTKDLSYQSNQNKYFTTALNFGYFISDHIVVGLIGVYHTDSYINDYNNTTSGNLSTNFYDQKSTSYNMGVFTRYYKMIGKSRFAGFCELKGTYVMGNSLSHNGYNNYPNPFQITETKSKLSGYNIGFRPGITYFINNTFALETSIGNFSYFAQNIQNSKDGKASGTDKTSNINANFSFSSFYLGLSFYFGGKKEVLQETAK